MPVNDKNQTLDENGTPLVNNNEDAWVYTVPWVNDQLTRDIELNNEGKVQDTVHTVWTWGGTWGGVWGDTSTWWVSANVAPTPPAPELNLTAPTAAPWLTELPVVDPSRVVNAIEGGITQTDTRQAELPMQTADRLLEESVQKDEQLLQTQEFAADRGEILKQKDESLAQVEANIHDLANNRAVRDAEALTRVKNSELEKANLAVEEQKLTNDLAIQDAEVKIETAKQQATWAFNKLWLGFSSGIINEVQRIATRGANELALTKVKGAKMLADTKVEVSKLEFQYASEINWMIDKYTDVQIGNKQNSAQRISDTQNNILMNSKQKEDAINKIKDEYKTETRTIQDDMRKEQERLADKLIGQTKTLEQQVSYEQNEERTSINRQFDNGTWFTLTPRQQWEQLAKAGLWLEEGAAMENTIFGKSITKEVDTALGGKVTITWADRWNIQNLSKNYMQGGLVFEEATKRATLDYIKNTPRLRVVQQVQDAALKAKLSGWSGSWDKKKNLERNDKWEFVLINETTWAATPVFAPDWVTPLVWYSEKLAELEALWITVPK